MESHPNPSFFLWKETVTNNIMNDSDSILNKVVANQQRVILASWNVIDPIEGVIAHHHIHKGLDSLRPRCPDVCRLCVKT